jgi:hypothetical protein
MQFQIKMSGDLEEKVKQARRIAAEHGVTFIGDSRKGKFSGRIMGGKLIGTYQVENGVLTVNITEKPFLATWSMVEGQIMGFLRS